VLYVNHTSHISGAEHSLLTTLEAMDGRVAPVVACPPGPLAERCRALGVEVRPIAPIEVSFRLTPRLAARGVRQLGGAARQLAAIAAATDADLVHANSIRAGLVGVAARRPAGPPLIAHVRDCLPQGTAAAATRRALLAGAHVIVANSRFTGSRFGGGAKTRIVHSPIDLARFDPGLVDRRAARATLGLSGDEPLLGVVGQITPWKGQDTAVRALARVRHRHPTARLAIVGEPKFVAETTRFDNRSFDREIRETARRLCVDEAVLFTGERDDVPEVLAALDVAMLPSWEEPLGRSGLEAMAMGTPLLATANGGLAELVQDGVSARLVTPRDDEAWGRAATGLLDDPRSAQEMARAGRAVAARCAPQAVVAELLEIYQETIDADGH
jgi:glycosyltransferase involved in cell wall biosynthesis